MLVTDNFSDFATDTFTTRLNGMGCRHLFTALRNPCPIDQSENSSRILKLLLIPLLLQHFINWEGLYTHLCCNIKMLNNKCFGFYALHESLRCYQQSFGQVNILLNLNTPQTSLWVDSEFPTCFAQLA